ncbi:signal-transducing adaptor protein 1-like [Pempheris klunzingeri]|uniref:signal-transducing adaptor protein 1-like n=1 Tax=Pempheris klunzingeri TaxID=3127111 RepID=UPI00397F9685
MAKRTGRLRNQLPACYYEGYLEKRSFRDKTSRKLWTCLCGNTLFFFSEKRDPDYIEKVDLSGLISITDDGTQDRNLDAARFTLQMKDGNIKFTAPSAEARELWKGYIHSVAELSVPSSLNLLPGQIHMLREAVDNEKERIKNAPQPAVTSSSPYISLQADMPACYHGVSRLEAELLLDREAKRGNLLLRPGGDGNSFAVTTRQDLDRPIFRHYRVTRKHEGGFAIDVDNPIPCATLHDVINYIVEKTDGVLIPLIMEESYDKNITFIRPDNENGERSIERASSNLNPPSVALKPVAPRIPASEPAPTPFIEESLYLNDTCCAQTIEEMEKDSPAVPPPQVEQKVPKKAMMPPVPAARKWASSTSAPSSFNSQDAKMRPPVNPLGLTISELKLKLEQKAKCQE